MGRAVKGDGALDKDKVAISKRKRLRLIKAHHRHNKPPSTMPATTTEMLATTQNMNNAYNRDSSKFRWWISFDLLTLIHPFLGLAKSNFIRLFLGAADLIRFTL